jgi:naphthalene 1,2-dioxygenase ferredoxin reductase component
VPYRVHVRQYDRHLTLARGETILEAALAAGLDYPCGCQSGNCGSCKSVLLKGEVEMAPYSEFALTGDERAAGMILACRAMPETDCEVAYLDPDEAVSHSRRVFEAKVVGLDDATHDIKRLRLEVAGEPLAFAAGQYAALRFDDLPARDFSMGNRPDDPVLEFHIRAIANGTASQYVAKRLKLGDRVRVEAPLGVSYLRQKHRGPILALAGGSGLAPIKSIVEQALAIGMAQPIRLYFGVRAERDLYLEDHFLALAARHPNFHFVPVLSEPQGPTARRAGFLSAAIAADFKSLDGSKVYLAGPPVMVESCVAAAQALGVRRDDCHADAFYTEADRAKLTAAP